jgi:hypothetical protein
MNAHGNSEDAEVKIETGGWRRLKKEHIFILPLNSNFLEFTSKREAAISHGGWPGLFARMGEKLTLDKIIYIYIIYVNIINKEKTMWTTEYTIITDASREAVWKTWSDVVNWPRWDQGIEWCQIEGAFATGTHYTLKPVGGPVAKAIITDCQPLKRFADVTKLPLAKMEFIHELKDEKDGLHVTHRVTISGPLSFLFAQVIGKDTARDLPETMGRLIQQAKELS